MTLFNENYEAVVIGLLLSYDHLHEQIIPKLNKFTFYEAKSRVIFDAIKTLFDTGEPINVATVSRTVKNITSDVAPADISKYLLDVKYTEDASHYTNHLLDMQQRRDVIATAQDPTADIRGVIDIVNNVTPDDDFGVNDGYTAFNDYLKVIEHRIEHPDEVIGIPFKWSGLNIVTSGLENGQLIYIGGRPGMGKSAILQNQHLHMALNGKHSMFISAEISEFSIQNNITGIFTGIPPKKLKSGKLTQAEIKQLYAAGKPLTAMKTTYKTQGAVTPLTVRNLAKKYRPDVICIDYLQLLKPENNIYRNDRTAQVAYVSNELKQVAKDLHIPIFVAVQLSRSLESRQDKRPLLSDLKQSGDIEQDADIVLFIYRDDYYNAPKDIEIEYSETEIILAKNREGANNYMIPAVMHMQTLRIDSTSTKRMGD